MELPVCSSYTQRCTLASFTSLFCTFREKPSVTVSLILKFGPNLAPDPTKPIQDHLRKNLGRLPAPVNQKTLIQSVRIVPPGRCSPLLSTCYYLLIVIEIDLLTNLLAIPITTVFYRRLPLILKCFSMITLTRFQAFTAVCIAALLTIHLPSFLSWQ